MDTRGDVREFAEGIIKDTLRPIMSEKISIYEGSKPSEDDPDFYVSILTEEERENMPGDEHWILNMAIVLATSLHEKGSGPHNTFRSQLRQGMFALQKIQNIPFPDKGLWFGGYVTGVETANRAQTYGEIFFFEVRAKV